MSRNKYMTFKERYANPEYRAKYIAQQSEKIKCTCGKDVQKWNISSHCKTKFHQNSFPVQSLNNKVKILLKE